MHLPRIRFLLLVALVSGSVFCVGSAAEPTTAPAPAPGKPVDDRSLLARETKQYLAKMTEERNELRQANETYATRQGLLVGYSLVMTVLAGWLMMRALTRRTLPATSGKAETDAFSASEARQDTAVTVRKNATITIRNGSTQKAEVTDQVQTRRAFARTDTGSHHRKTTATFSAPPARTPTPAKPASVIAPELDPATPVQVPIPTATTKRTTGTGTTQRPTVRVEQQASDRLAPIDVGVKPGTTRTHRTPRPVTER